MDKEKREFYAGYRRILKIDGLLSCGKYPSTNEIIEALIEDGEGKFSVSTIKRDIERMKIDLNAPIEYSKKYEGWYYSSNAFRLPAMFTTESELFAAELAKEIIIKKLPGTGTEKDAESVLNTITNTVENPLTYVDSGPNSWMKERIIVLEENSEKIDEEVWKLISDAIKANREIEFTYQGLGSLKPKKRRVRPYQLILGQGQWNLGHSYWNLYGYDCGKKENRVFVVSHIKNPSILIHTFKYDKRNDYRNKANGVFGVYINDKVFTFKLRFYWQSADMVKDRIWGDNQTICKIEDGVELTFDSCQYHAILRWALSCGCECYPLEPKEFVNDWRRDIKLMYQAEMDRNRVLGLKNALDSI